METFSPDLCYDPGLKVIRCISGLRRDGGTLVPVRNTTGTKGGGVSPEYLIPVVQPGQKGLTNLDKSPVSY